MAEQLSRPSATDGFMTPKIVAASDDPPSAMAAFIAQELETWGFDLHYEGHATIEVFLPGDIVVEVRRNG